MYALVQGNIFTPLRQWTSSAHHLTYTNGAGNSHQALSSASCPPLSILFVCHAWNSLILSSAIVLIKPYPAN